LHGVAQEMLRFTLPANAISRLLLMADRLLQGGIQLHKGDQTMVIYSSDKGCIEMIAGEILKSSSLGKRVFMIVLKPISDHLY
jgi:hypothetical protein